MRHHQIRAFFLSGLALTAGALALAAAADHDAGVTLYVHDDFGGFSETFHDDVPSLKDTHFGQDRASSVRVDPGCTVTLYQHVDYRGRSTTLTRDAYRLRGTEVGNDSVSSLRIRCRSRSGDGPEWSRQRGVTLFSDADFGGRREVFYEDDSNLRNNRIGNDAASSLRVAPGCRAILYSDGDFRGRSTAFDHDIENLRGTGVGNDTVSSLRIECDRHGDRPFRRPGRRPRSASATLYTDVEYRGRSEEFHRDVPRLGDTRIGNDTLSSVRVDRGCRLVIFEHDDYRGNRIVLTGDAPSLKGTRLGNDRASSLQLDCGRFGAPERDRHAGYGGVTLFRDAHFRGHSETLYGDVRNLRGTPIGNDSVSSVRVDPGCRAILYRDSDFRGRSAVLTGDASDLSFTPVGNDSLSSVEVDCRDR